MLTTQARQVFYIEDRLHGSTWKVVHHYSYHHIWDIPSVVVADNGHDGTLVLDVMQETSSEAFELVVELLPIDTILYCRPGTCAETVADKFVLSIIEIDDEIDCDEDVDINEIVQDYFEDNEDKDI